MIATIDQLNESFENFTTLSDSLNEYTIRCSDLYKINYWLRPIYKISYPGNIFVMLLSQDMIAKIRNRNINYTSLVFTVKINNEKQIRMFPCDSNNAWEPTAAETKVHPWCTGVKLNANRIIHPGGIQIDFPPTYRGCPYSVNIKFSETHGGNTVIRDFKKNGLATILSLGGKLVDCKNYRV